MTARPSYPDVWALCRVPRAEVCFVRYTLEAYEGLCIPTTLPGGAGRLRLLTSREQKADLDAVLRSLADQVALVVESWGEGGGGEP